MTKFVEFKVVGFTANPLIKKLAFPVSDHIQFIKRADNQKPHMESQTVSNMSSNSLSSALQIYNRSQNTAVLNPSSVQFFQSTSKALQRASKTGSR